MVTNQAAMSLPVQVNESSRRSARTNVSAVRSSARWCEPQRHVEVAVDDVDVLLVDLAERLRVAALREVDQGLDPVQPLGVARTSAGLGPEPIRPAGTAPAGTAPLGTAPVPPAASTAIASVRRPVRRPAASAQVQPLVGRARAARRGQRVVGPPQASARRRTDG